MTIDVLTSALRQCRDAAKRALDYLEGRPAAELPDTYLLDQVQRARSRAAEACWLVEEAIRSAAAAEPPPEAPSEAP